jgi:hypothetical protein
MAGVEEIGVVPVAEAAEGEIIDTMPGAYLFAFSKKAFSPNEDDQGKSSPSPSSPPHHAHMQMQWPPRHLFSRKDLS